MEIDLLENCYRITKVLRKLMIKRSIYRSKDSNVRLTQIIFSTSTLSLLLNIYQVIITSVWFKHACVYFQNMGWIYRRV